MAWGRVAKRPPASISERQAHDDRPEESHPALPDRDQADRVAQELVQVRLLHGPVHPPSHQPQDDVPPDQIGGGLLRDAAPGQEGDADAQPDQEGGGVAHPVPVHRQRAQVEVGVEGDGDDRAQHVA